MAWSLIKPDGTEVKLADLSVSVREVPGAGLPPLEQVTVRTGTEMIYQRSLVNQRSLVLKLMPRERSSRLGALRLALLQALNPHLVSAERPAYLRYSSEAKMVQVPVIYNGGLEDEAVTLAGKEGKLELHLVSYEPIWTAKEMSVQSPAPAVRTLFDGNQVVRRVWGVWSSLPALDGVEVLFTSRDGTLYAGGSFAGRLKYWNGVDWQTVMGASGIGNGTVYAIVERPDGSLYIGGSFSSPAVRIVRYDPATPVWDTTMSDPGFDVHALLYTSTGIIYAGGAGPTIKSWFNNAWWSTSSFSGGTAVYALAELRNGDIIAAGDFSGGVARWSMVSWESLGGGLSLFGPGTFVVNALAVGIEGTLYVAGKFNQAGDGLLGVSNVAQWNGTTWYPLSFGPGTTVTALAVRPSDGVLFVGGQFDTVDGRTVPGKLAQWNGYAWFALDLSPSADVDVRAMTAGDDDLTIVYSGAVGSSTAAAAVTTITNEGNASTYPLITITGPGTVYELVNQTTGDVIAFNLTLLDGEVLTIDLRPGAKTVISSFRGNLVSTIIPGSSVAAWRLEPGENRIALFIDHADASAAIRWYARYWSLDAL